MMYYTQDRGTERILDYEKKCFTRRNQYGLKNASSIWVSN